MKKIIDIYEEYKIMPGLQMHQLRVAAIAFQICDSLDIDVDKESILTACLLHDMGNIIKFHLDYFPEFSKPEGLEYWQRVQEDYIDKYGKNEHSANVAISKELGVLSHVTELIDSTDPSFIQKTKDSLNFEEKICIYADERVTPHGIVSVDERSEDAKKRYANHPNAFDEHARTSFVSIVKDIEKQIFLYSKIKPEDINDESTVAYIKKLKFFVI